MTDLNHLPCELGRPGDRPIPVDPIDGGSVDQPEDDGDDIIRPPIFPVPTVWACIPVSPGVHWSGRECKEYLLSQVPANVIEVYGSKDECEYACIPALVCRRNRITGVLECKSVKKAELLAGERTYNSFPECNLYCREDNPPGGGGGGGGGGGPGPATPGPGPGPATPTGPGNPCPPRTYYYCIRRPLGPITPAPCPSVGVPRPNCTCIKTEDVTCTSITVNGVRDASGNCNYIFTTPFFPGDIVAEYGFGPNAAANCAIGCQDVYRVICPDGRTDIVRAGPATPGPSTGGPGPSTGGPIRGPVTGGGGGGGGGPTTGGPLSGTPTGGTTAGPFTQGPSTGGPGPGTGVPPGTLGVLSSVNYYYCKTTQTTVPCRYVRPGTGLGTGGASVGRWVEDETFNSGNCLCTKTVKTCEIRRHSYYLPNPPPPPAADEYVSCAAVPNCGTIRLSPIPESCPQGPTTADPRIVIPPGTVDPRLPGNTDGGDGGETTTRIPPTVFDPGTVTPQIPDTGNGGTNTDDGGVIITPTDGTQTRPVQIPDNQDGNDISEYQYDPTLIDGTVEPGYTFGDETYAVTTQQSNFTILTESNLYTDLFKNQRDTRIQVLLENAQKILSDLNAAMAALSLTNIKDSIKQDVVDILFNLTYPDGRPIPQSRIVKAIKKHIIEGTTTSIDVGYIYLLKSRALLSDDAVARILDLPTTQFGQTKTAIINQRRQAKQGAISTTIQIDTTPNQTRGVIRAIQKAKPLDPDRYSDQTSELLKLWYILPTDINTRVPVSTSSGDVELFVRDTNTIPITTSSGSAITLPVSRLHYSVSVLPSGAPITSVNSINDIHRAFALQNIVEQASLYDVGAKWETLFTVTSPSADNKEFNYNLNSVRPEYYVLNIDRSSIENMPTDGTVFARKTKVRYTRETNAANIREAAKFRVYPWKIYTVNHNDPILDHFTTGTTYEFVFTNFTLNNFGTNSGEQLFVRRIPELIIILPTDKYNLNFFNGYSRLLDWNQRRMIFSQSPDPRYYKTGLALHWLKIEDTYPNTDIDGVLNYNGKKGTFTGRAGVLAQGFLTGSEQLPRMDHGFRASVNLVSSMYTNYQINEGILWSDLFVRMTLEQYKTFKIGIPNTMIDKLRFGDKTGVKLLENRNDAFIKETRLLGLRNSSSQEVPINLGKLTNKRLL